MQAIWTRLALNRTALSSVARMQDPDSTLNILSANKAHRGSSDVTQKSTQRREVKTRPMKFRDVSTAVTTLEEAFKDDPFHDYLNNTPDSHPGIISSLSRKFDATVMWTDFTFLRQAWTVDDGNAVVGYHAARSTWGFATKVLGFVIGRVFAFKNSLTLSQEQKKRAQELREKHGKAMQEILGNSAAEVINLQILATSPSKQGRGYASALVQTVLRIAAAQRRMTFLTSSNSVNNGFYESFGFVKRGEVTLGDDNPTWRKAPLVLTLMTYDSSQRKLR